MSKDNCIVRSEEDGIEFYTDNTTGESGMSISGLALCCGVDRKAIRYILNNPGNKIAESLIEQGFYLGTAEKNGGSASIIKDIVCAEIIAYYMQQGKVEAAMTGAKFMAAGIRKWIHVKTGYSPTQKPAGSPFWYERLKMFRSKSKVPEGYFSIFEETLDLVADMEAKGFVLPSAMTPDCSIGKCWANHLRSIGIDPSMVAVTYDHYYPDHRKDTPVNPFAYPESMLPDYRKWFREEYKPIKLPKYMKGKYPDALPVIEQLLLG